MVYWTLLLDLLEALKLPWNPLVDGSSAGAESVEPWQPSQDGEGASVSGSSGQQPPLLSVDMKKLRAEDELRRIFGSKVVDAERAAEQQQVSCFALPRTMAAK